MNRQNVLAGALALALVSTPAAAADDPITEFFDGIFQPSPDVYYGKASRRRARHARAYATSPATGGGNMVASYYGGGERLNAHTANGERFRSGGFTAAHRSLPFGTLLSVCYRGCATVRINDRGPAAWTGRSLDLARGAASAIGLTGPGVGRVHASVLD